MVSNAQVPRHCETSFRIFGNIPVLRIFAFPATVLFEQAIWYAPPGGFGGSASTERMQTEKFPIQSNILDRSHNRVTCSRVGNRFDSIFQFVSVFRPCRRSKYIPRIVILYLRTTQVSPQSFPWTRSMTGIRYMNGLSVSLLVGFTRG